MVNPFAAQFCEVEVNLCSGEVKILRFLGAHESGRVMNRLTFDNQVYGGITMGIGLAMTEWRVLDENRTGKIVNRNWHDYKLPTALDVPAEKTSLPIDLPDSETNITGAKGLGEPVAILTAAAIANAVYNATGIRMEESPINPITIMHQLVGRQTEVAENPIIREKYDALAKGAAEVASPQLRNQGTIGGNICQKPRCWYYRGEFDCLRKGGKLCYADGGENAFHCILGGYGCYIVHPSDTAPSLVALKATAHVAGPSGNRKIPLADFHILPADDPRRETILEPAEVVTEIWLPAPPAGLRSSYRKVRARRSWDFALAGVALALVMEGDAVKDGRIVLSGAAPVPWRSREAEDAVIGRSITPDTAKKAAAAAMAIAEPLAQNDYKIPLFKGMIEEELLKLGAG